MRTAARPHLTAAGRTPRPAAPVPSQRGALLQGAGTLDVLAGAAARAVPVLPGQSWRLRAGTNGIEVHADHRRPAPRDGRLLDVACGAALFALRVAVRSLGGEPVVRLLPRSPDPSLFAHIRVAGPAVRRMPEDRFHAGPFDAGAMPVPVAARTAEAQLGSLAEEAEFEGTSLVILGPAGASGHVAALLTLTDAREDRLRTGMALQRVSMAAAHLGLRVTPLTEGFRSDPRAERATGPALSGGVPQLLVHVGLAGASDAAPARG